MIVFLTVLFVIVCILLVFMVVITPSQEGGMAAAFGGVGSDSFFGTKAHQTISKFTVFLAVSFLVLAFAINKYNASAVAARGGGAPGRFDDLPPPPADPAAPGQPKLPVPPPPPPK
jgi:protein translocase SecG subunit